jgi:2-C-methyl-D-erythritol 4-phosphate cytidylyltransferase
MKSKTKKQFMEIKGKPVIWYSLFEFEKSRVDEIILVTGKEDIDYCKKEIVEKYNCGICVDPHNSQQIKEAIQYLVENKEMAYQMGQNGRRAVLEEYNWESQAKLYIEVLTNI